MDVFGREGSDPDPSQEWSGRGPETGIEAWQLEGESAYPERPEEPNCIYYLRTGFCGYGSRCRFNHPRDRAAVLGAIRGSVGEFPERVGQPVCQYYMRTGTCKFGASCKYHHPKEGGGSSTALQLNYFGFPLRPGEKECTYYLKTGQCKFGSTCKFHHPMPANFQVPAQSPSAVYPPSASPSQQYGLVLARSPIIPSYVPAPYGSLLLSPSVYPSWTHFPASRAMYGLTPVSPSPPAYGGAYISLPASSAAVRENPFPERPGQPECQYYMKTGDCKYGSTCRYHHPPELIAPPADVVLNSVGLPLRPGVPSCSYFAQHGQCKYGAACMFDHPMTLSYSPSASSLTDMPVAPYPVGTSMGTLAPSSSSFDMRPELASVESSLTRMSSASVSRGLVGLFLPSTGSSSSSPSPSASLPMATSATTSTNT